MLGAEVDRSPSVAVIVRPKSRSKRMQHCQGLLDGFIAETGIDAADIVFEANGATLAPGLIDSHCHVALGDYTPRQKAVDFLASSVHGGITSVVSPGEIHAQGRPHSTVGGKRWRMPHLAATGH